MKFLIVEDQPMMRNALARACLDALPEKLCLEVDNHADGLRLARKHHPSLIILDLGLPDGDGVDLISEFRTFLPKVKIVVVTVYVDEYTMHRIHSLQVDGFVSKAQDDMDVFIEAVRQVADGGTYRSPALLRAFEKIRMEPTAFSKLLSKREQQLLILFGQGMSNETIAKHEGVSPNTVRNHRQNIMLKLNIRSTPQLISYALSKGFVRHRI